MQPTITIIGASVRAAAFSALRAGYRVRAGDEFGDVDLCAACETLRVKHYPHGLVAALRGSHEGGWMYSGALENYPRQVDRWARLRPLWGNSGKVLRRVRDPRLVAQALFGAGLPCPEVAADGGSRADHGQWLRKPLRSGGGANVAIYEPHAPREAASGEFYLQQFVEGIPCSAVFVAAQGRAVLLGLTRQLIGTAWLGASGFRYCGSIGPFELAPQQRQTMERIGDVLANQFELIGLFGVDAIVNADGVWPIEVNPRYTASIEVLERAFGLQAVDFHLRACQSADLPSLLAPRCDRQFGKAILFASRTFTIPSDWSDAAGASPEFRQPTLADIPPAGSTIESGLPVLTVFAAGNSPQQVVLRLEIETSRLAGELNCR